MSKKTDDNSGDIDLMGWDTVFALSLDAVNASIVAQKTTPPSFSGTDTQGGAVVTGSWGDWSVTGGEGDGIILRCPVPSGSNSILTMPGDVIGSLDGGYVDVMITLETRGTKQPLTDPTAKPGTGTTKVFQANQTTDEFQSPKVQDVQFPGLQNVPYGDYAAMAAFTAYFQDNIGLFDAVFSAVILEEEAVDAGKQWLKPAASLYGLAKRDKGSGSQVDNAFAVLSLTSSPSQKLPQQNFDIRMFDVFSGTSTPTNSVFAASAPLSMANIVLASAQHCVMGATTSDFEITNNGVTVTNKNTLNWGNFKLNNDSNQTVTPVIQPGNFSLNLDAEQFHLSISQAAFTSPDGTCDIKITADQFFNMGAVQLSNGKYYFKPSPGLGTNSIRADVSPNEGFEIASIIESVAVGIALGFLGGFLGDALGSVFTSTVENGEGAIVAGEEAMEEGISKMSPQEITETENSAANEAGNAIKTGGSEPADKTGLVSTKWKVWGGILGGMLAIPISTLPQIMELIWNDAITEGNVPTIDDFATNFSAAVQWPQVPNWQVTGGTFRGAFLLGGNAS